MSARTIVLLALFAVIAQGVSAQTIEYRCGNYRFTYEDHELDIESIGTSFMALRAHFTELCGFDPDPEVHFASVRILPDRSSFDRYLESRIGETRNQYVFLKYGKPELSELVLYPVGEEKGYEAFAGPSLNRQLFLQYLYGYVLEPPVWLRDGFQAWVENLSVDDGDQDGYSPWLETAKNYAMDPEKSLPVRSILLAETGTYEAARLYPLSWALVAFFLQTERTGYRRFLHETFAVLESPDGYNRRTQEENTRVVHERFDRTARFASADEDFMNWISGQKTFTELLNAGVAAYTSGRYAEAEKNLVHATELQKNDPLPFYYLGLSAYASGDHDDARMWYLRALDNGADAATVHWAISLTAYAVKDWQVARLYMEKARELNPSRYAEKAENLLRSMPE